MLEFDGVRWNAYPFPTVRSYDSLTIDEARAGFMSAGRMSWATWRRGSGRTALRFFDRIYSKAYRSFEDVWRVFPIGEGVFFCTQRTIFMESRERCCPLSLPGGSTGFELEGSVYVRDTEQGCVSGTGRELELVPDGAAGRYPL